MEPGGNVLVPHHVAVHQRHVLLAVAVVPEGHDAEPAESSRQVRHRVDPYADVGRAEAAAVVILVPGDQVFQAGHGNEAVAGRGASVHTVQSNVLGGRFARRRRSPTWPLPWLAGPT